jgi:hypothetical protein
VKVRQPYTDEEKAFIDGKVRVTAHPAQEGFCFDTANYLSLLTGRGAGKTTAALLRLVRHMVHHADANCLFIAATRQSAERLVWRDLKRVLFTLRINPKVSEQNLTIELRNGSRLMLFGCDDKRDINKLRGITYHAVVVDETASIPSELLRELLDEVIGPRMIGWLALIGTPGKILEGRFYDVTRPGSERHRPYADRDKPEFADWADWSSHAWTVRDGAAHGIKDMVLFLEKAQLKKRNEGWSDTNPYWVREYEGQWIADDSASVYVFRAVDDSGAPFNVWDPLGDRHLAAEDSIRHVLAALPGNRKDWAFGIGLDVGFKDAFAIEVFGFSYTDPRRALWHIHEVYLTRQYANTIAKLLIGEALDHKKYGGIIGALGEWPVAMVGDFARSGHQLLEELSNVYGIPITAADKPYHLKANSIELANSMLVEGQVKLLKGSNVAREMTTLQWVVDRFGKRMETPGQDNHGSDAFIYLRDALASLLPNVAGEPLSSPTRPNPDDDMPKRDDEPAMDSDSMYTDGDWL